MAVVKMKPTSPGRRHQVRVVNKDFVIIMVALLLVILAVVINITTELLILSV